MCGRFTLTVTEEELNNYLSEQFAIDSSSLHHHPRYNIAPSQPVSAVIHDGKTHRFGPLTWGFVPPWIKDEDNHFTIINARSETLTTKKTFVHAYKHKRCLILSDGYFEWRSENNKKQPYYFTLNNHALFAFAGLWTKTTYTNGNIVYSCAIITTEASPSIRDFHERMPVIVPPKHYDTWLDPSIKDTDQLDALLTPYDTATIHTMPVSNQVNNAAHDAPECIAEQK